MDKSRIDYRYFGSLQSWEYYKRTQPISKMASKNGKFLFHLLIRWPLKNASKMSLRYLACTSLLGDDSDVLSGRSIWLTASLLEAWPSHASNEATRCCLTLKFSGHGCIMCFAVTTSGSSSSEQPPYSTSSTGVICRHSLGINLWLFFL